MAAKSVYENRVNNLHKLVARYEGQRPICRLVNLAESALSRLLRWTPGTDNPYHKRMGEGTARKIELGLKLPQYWMDQPHDEDAFDDVSIVRPDPSALDIAAEQTEPNLTSIQAATRDTLVKLMASGKLPDSACLKLLQTWQGAIEELEASRTP